MESNSLKRSSRMPIALLVGGRGLLWILLVGWLAVTALLFSRLGFIKAARLVPDPAFARLALDSGSRGWRVVHVLSDDPSLNVVLFRHWQNRGPIPGLPEEIVAPADHPPLHDAQRRRLAAAGWRFSTVHSPAPSEPRLEVHAPDGSVAWAGTYRAADLRTAGDAIWDQLVIAGILSGQKLPRYVPAACAIPSPSPNTTLLSGPILAHLQR